jgi:hypothetical protein
MSLVEKAAESVVFEMVICHAAVWADSRAKTGS